MEHASQAVLGRGTQVQYETTPGGGTYTQMHECFGVTPPVIDKAKVDVTHFESPGGTKEYIPGFKDTAEATFSLNWRPDVYADHQQVLDDLETDIKRSWRIVLPGGMHTITFPATVKSIALADSPEDRITMVVTLTVDNVTHEVPVIS